MESLASGTPVLTFRTGGSPEMLDEATGFVVEKDDIDGLERVILSLDYTSPKMREACLRKAAAFDQGERFREYLALYDEASAEQ
jgi:glycosyltransferase involved in cell wall biosynthesis